MLCVLYLMEIIIVNINKYDYFLTILDSDNSTNTIDKKCDFFSKEELDNAKEQCCVWNIEDAPNILGRQYKSTIIGLGDLLYHIKHKTDNNIVYISQTDKKLLRVYKSQPRIHYAIHKQLIEKAKVLCDLKTEYKPHSEAKYYYVCLENLDTMIELYESIKNFQIESLFTDGEITYCRFPVYYLFPSFNSNLAIHEDYSVEEVKEAIIKLYPCIPYYYDLVKKLNAQAIDDEKIKFDITPTFSSKGKITKLGIRASSRVCSLKSLEKQKKKHSLLGSEYVVNSNIRYREHYLNDRFGEWEEYDIKGSVPRISRAMANNGDMGDLNEDIYRTIFEPFVQDYQLYFDSSVTEWCESVRAFFKLLFMRLFFGGTPKQIVGKILSKEKKEKAKAIKNSSPDINLTPFSSLVENGVDLVLLIDKYQKRVFEVCHRPITKRSDTSVFLHESCIYLEVRNELFRRGIDVVQIYDGFYFKKGTLPPDMDEIIQRAASEYCNGNRKFAIFNTLQNISKELHDTPISLSNITTLNSVISASDIIDTNIEFIKPKRKK